MNTSSDFQKDSGVAGEVDTTTDTNTSVAANMPTTNVAGASDAPRTPTVKEPLPDLDVSEQLDGGATSDRKLVANEEPKSHGKPDTIRQIRFSGSVNVEGWTNLTAQGDLNGQVTVTGKINLDGLVDLNELANMGGLVKVTGNSSIVGQVVPTNMLRRLPTELRVQIFDLVMSDGVPGAPAPIPDQEKFIRTLKMPAITMVDRQIRDEVLGPFLRGKQFSVQLPRDPEKIRKLESLQELAMDRRRSLIQDSDESLEEMKEHAKETEQEFQEFLENAQDMDLCPFRFVGSLIVTYNGRFRLNVDDGTTNWSPRSILVGFRCYDDVGFENWKSHSDTRKQLNADGDLDWTDFEGVRKAFAAALIRTELWFSYVPYIDVLMHPMVQPLVKALCMFAWGQEKPLRWVEVIAVEFISICSIPNGLGVEWSSLTYEEAVYESEPDDGFGIYPDGRCLSDEEGSCDGSEDGSAEEHEEEEDEVEEQEESSDDADSSGQDDVSDGDKSDCDNINQMGVVVTSEETREEPVACDELEADKHSEGNHDAEVQPEEV